MAVDIEETGEVIGGGIDPSVCELNEQTCSNPHSNKAQTALIPSKRGD